MNTPLPSPSSVTVLACAVKYQRTHPFPPTPSPQAAKYESLRRERDDLETAFEERLHAAHAAGAKAERKLRDELRAAVRTARLTARWHWWGS